MTADDLPVTDGSLVHDDVERQYRAEVYAGVVRWRPVGEGHDRPWVLLTPEQLAERGPVVDLVAPSAVRA